MKKLFVLALIAGATFIGYRVGYAHARGEVHTLVLAGALEKTSLCANGLNTLAAQRDNVTVKLLDHQLRAAVASAEEAIDSAADIELAIPSLTDGLARAKAYADRIGDSDLARRIDALHARLATKMQG